MDGDRVLANAPVERSLNPPNPIGAIGSGCLGIAMAWGWGLRGDQAKRKASQAD